MSFNAKILNDKTDIDKNNILILILFYTNTSCWSTFLSYDCSAIHNKAK